MTSEVLFESLQYLDDGILEAAGQFHSARPAWTRWAAAAACVCVVAWLAWAVAETHAGRSMPAAAQRAAVMPAPLPDREDAEMEWEAGYTPAPGERDEGDYSYGLDWEPRPAETTVPTPDLPVTEDGLLPERQKPNSGEAWRPPLPASASDLDVETPEPTPMPSGAPGPWAGGVYLPREGGGEAVCGYPPLISSYDAGEAASAACYATPKNGEAGYSIPLRGAMEEYGDGVLYRVAVELFRDGRQLAPDGPEAEAERERLAALGYTVAYETYFDGESERHFFTLHLRYAQLADFAAGADYGYMLFLYDERVH